MHDTVREQKKSINLPKRTHIEGIFWEVGDS